MYNKINENGLLKRVITENISSNYDVYIPEVLTYFQNIASTHSELAGYSKKRLLQLNRAWLIRSWSIDILSYAKNTPFEVATWTTQATKLQANRNFSLKDSKNVLCIQAKSKWFLVDTTKNKPIKIEQDFFNSYIPSTIPNINSLDYLKTEKLDYKTKVFDIKFDIIKEYIDENHHINNIVYIRYCLELLNSITDLTPVHIDALYIREIKEHQSIKIDVHKLSNIFYFNFTDLDNNIYASIKITI